MFWDKKKVSFKWNHSNYYFRISNPFVKILETHAWEIDENPLKNDAKKI